jgi:hypothetical protein
MRPPSRERAALKFLAWLLVSAALFGYAINEYASGAMLRWYYYQAKADGYAVNARAFAEATPAHPAALQIGAFTRVDGLRAVRVRAGDRLPEGATGVIDADTVRKGMRARLDGDHLLVLVPWEVRESNGFTFRDGFAHKNIRANPLSGVWNLVMVLLMGLSLGLMAEGFTDLLGVRLQKSDHTVSRGEGA